MNTNHTDMTEADYAELERAEAEQMFDMLDRVRAHRARKGAK